MCYPTTAIVFGSIAEYHVHQTPIKVLIKEAVKNTQIFSEFKDYKFVNKILDLYFKGLQTH